MSRYIDIERVKDLMACSDRTVRRYVRKGLIKTKGVNKGTVYREKDVRALVSEVAAKKDKHNPTPDAPTPEYIPPKEITETNKPPSELLSELGKMELMRVTKRLEDNGLLESTDPTVLMKYALLQQLWFKYTEASLNLGGEDYYMKVAEQYQKQVFQYEKELGLTTASMLKMKPPEPKGAIDPFEEMLNG